MKEMVNAFSDYARSPTWNSAPIDLNALIVDVLELYKGERDGQWRLFEIDLDGALEPIEGDRDRLRQVLHNLLTNAIEASLTDADTGAPPTVWISTERADEGTARYVDIRIADNGSGINPDLADRLFEPYVSTKTKGTGLGLAIVKKIIEEHGGLVWANNRADGGAEFTIRLPLAEQTLTTEQRRSA